MVSRNVKLTRLKRGREMTFKSATGVKNPDMMKIKYAYQFKLTVYPALEIKDLVQTLWFDTQEEMEGAAFGMSMLLIFIQDQAKLMGDYSNMFIREQLKNGEWVLIEKDDDED